MTNGRTISSFTSFLDRYEFFGETYVYINRTVCMQKGGSRDVGKITM